uniref:Interleukin 17a/f1 n=1 Tax=Monopterus albus TaxID=43700 RepID=A0A3Q3QWG2_MONAL|nr:interleukin-17F-like [Monopterus albus]
MFPASNSFKVTAACTVAMIMMMMMMVMTTDAAAMPKGAHHLKHLNKKSSDSTAVEMVALQLDPNSFVTTTTIKPLANVSISPWTYNISHDESVFPPVSEARCLLQGCLDAHGQEDLNLQSRPIMQQVLMLRQVKPAGEKHSYHYRLETRLVAVGCTCVRPIVQRQQ